MAIFSREALWMGTAARHTTKSGVRPSTRSSLTLCCVGLVFCSASSPTMGTMDTCTRQKFSRFTRSCVDVLMF